jgi:hypothetical protein
VAREMRIDLSDIAWSRARAASHPAEVADERRIDQQKRSWRADVVRVGLPASAGVRHHAKRAPMRRSLRRD